MKPALPTQVSLAVVFQVRDEELHVLLWKRALDPFKSAWSLPGGYLEPGETLEKSILSQLAHKVDVKEVAHLEQLGAYSDPKRHPDEWQLAQTFLGLVQTDHDPQLPDDTVWHPVDKLPKMAFDHRQIVHAGRERLRGKLSYTNIAFALAPNEFTITELRVIYRAALGYDVSPTNLQRVLLRREVIAPVGDRRSPGAGGGRPAALYSFTDKTLTVTDPFAVLSPRL